MPTAVTPPWQGRAPMPHPQLRVTNQDREQVVEHVKAAYAEGRLGLFEGTSGAFSGYDAHETLAGVMPGARLDGQAGAQAGVPVVADWTLGSGFAIHTGLPQLAARAEAGDADAAALVRRIWSLLAHGA